MQKTKKEQALLKKEYTLLVQEERKFFDKKVKAQSGLSARIREKAPDKAVSALEKAFEKGFFLLFDKGDFIIEKIANIDKAKAEAEEFHRSLNRMVHPATLKAIDKAAMSRINNTKSITTLEGVGLGVFGIGLPDIPIFLAMLLKTVSEIGAAYGFDYRDEEEKPYTLAILKTAFSGGDERLEYSEECDVLGRLIDDDEYVETDISSEDLAEVARVLASDMLVAKVVQGWTFVGVVGGFSNLKLVKKIANVARIKYKKRFLYKLINED